MATPNQANIMQVDWAKIPAPQDDGGTRHLTGMRLPEVTLPASDGSAVSLATCTGRTVVYAYPRMGKPGQIALVEGWDEIPGARGCTPQSCAFRDHFADLRAAGATQVFGLSTQDSAYQAEAVARLNLPFAILSDEHLVLTRALRLPTLEVANLNLIKRLAMVIDAGRISKVFYPVFPPDRNASDVLAWLKDNPRT
jgi:peroxiredoxin